MSRADKKHPINIDDLYDLFEYPADDTIDYSDIEEHTPATPAQKHRVLGAAALAFSGMAYMASKSLDLGKLGAMLNVEHLTEKAQMVGYTTSALFAAVAATIGVKMLANWSAQERKPVRFLFDEADSGLVDEAVMTDLIPGAPAQPAPAARSAVANTVRMHTPEPAPQAAAATPTPKPAAAAMAPAPLSAGGDLMGDLEAAHAAFMASLTPAA
jgi:hypothetical protein